MFRATCLLSSLACGLLLSAPAQAETVTLAEAIRGGLVEVVITGRSACTGDAVKVDVRRLVDRDLTIQVDTGVTFESQTGSAQNMLISQVRFEYRGGVYAACDSIHLSTNVKTTFICEAYCGNFARRTPKPTDGFNVRTTNDVAVKIFNRGKQVKADKKIIQAALWIKLENVSDAQLKKRFHCNEEELRAAHQLVDVSFTADVDIEPVQLGNLKNLMADLRQRAKAALEAGLSIGGQCEITEDDVELLSPVAGIPDFLGPAKLKKGTQLMVTGFDGDDVFVFGNINGLPRAGRVKLSAVRPHGEGPPGSREAAEAVLQTLDRVGD